jgi:cytochrome oxidase Cu insertion factor (SCO1/SenC/PrrC family)
VQSWEDDYANRRSGHGHSRTGDRRRPGEKVPKSQADLQAYQARNLREHFPNVVLINQDKKKLHFYDDLIKGKLVVIQFMFTNCERFCPMVTPNLVKVQDELQKRAPGEVSIVSITVDPDHDTPDVLKAYGQKFHIQKGWQFLTGRKSDIEGLRRELGLYYPEDKQFEHMNMITIGKEPTGQWLSMRALNIPDVIAYTVLLLTNHSTRAVVKPDSASQLSLVAGK